MNTKQNIQGDIKLTQKAIAKIDRKTERHLDKYTGSVADVRILMDLIDDKCSLSESLSQLTTVLMIYVSNNWGKKTDE